MAKKINVLGVWIDVVSVEELHAHIETAVARKEHALILHVNAHALNLGHSRPWLRAIFNGASLVFGDGIGVTVAARLLNRDEPARIPITEWIWDLAARAEVLGMSMYLLGGRPGIAEAAADRLRTRFPKLRIVGCHDGYFDKRYDSPTNRSLVRSINAVRPDILVVGFGMPIQELWLHENWHDIDAGVALTGGAVLDYTAGALRRGPRVLTNNGLEWVARLLVEPGRLWRRYLLGNPLFLTRVIKQRLRRPSEA